MVHSGVSVALKAVLLTAADASRLVIAFLGVQHDNRVAVHMLLCEAFDTLCTLVVAGSPRRTPAHAQVIALIRDPDQPVPIREELDRKNNA